MRPGPDGRLYVAEMQGSQISAIDLATGEVAVVAPMGGEMVGPDDLAFDSAGDMYVTEFTLGRVSIRDRRGNTRVLRGDLPGANGVTVHQGRLFVDECRMGGRILELDPNGGEPRVLLS